MNSRQSRRHPSGVIIGRTAGAPVVVSGSWFFGAVIIAVLFAPTAANVVGGSTGTLVGVTAAFALILFGSVLAHEIAHAAVARRHGHRVSAVVLSAWGGHTSYESHGATPRSHFLIAGAGPLTNVVLAVVFGGAYRALSDGGLTEATLIPALLLYAGAFANGFVAAFNLLPSIPLDGGMMLEAGIWAATGRRRTGTRVAAWSGRVLAALVVLWLVVRPALAGEGVDPVGALWALVIAALLWTGASGALRNADRNERLERYDVWSFARPATEIGQDVTVGEVLTVAAQHEVGHVVLRDFAHRPALLVGVAEARAAGATAADPASAVATRLAPAPTIPAASRGVELLGHIGVGARSAPTLVVVDGDRVVGVLHVADVVAAVNRT